MQCRFLNDFPGIFIFMVSHRRLASTSLFLYSFATSLIVFLIKSIYSSSDKGVVFNFQKPGLLGFVLFVRCNVMSEWSVLKPGKMSALEVVDIKLAPPDFVFS